MKKLWLRRILLVLTALAVMGAALVICINTYIKADTADRILTPEEAAGLSDVECILVLGCWVMDNGKPSHMLNDRLTRSLELYEMEVAPKLLMSGDHGTVEYNEVRAMKEFAVEKGVPSENVFMDHAGFCTYDSLYRAKEVFGANKIVIVTQEYHLSRALYIAERLGISAYGVSCDYRTYAGQSMREIREIAARVKDFIITIFVPEPRYLGELIPISGNGDLTNDY